MSLLAEFLNIVRDWRTEFPQQRTFQRGVRQALGSRVCLGRRCLSRIIWTNGGQNRSWSAEYFLHSRCRWEPQGEQKLTHQKLLLYDPQAVQQEGPGAKRKHLQNVVKYRESKEGQHHEWVSNQAETLTPGRRSPTT